MALGKKNDLEIEIKGIEQKSTVSEHELIRQSQLFRERAFEIRQPNTAQLVIHALKEYAKKPNPPAKVTQSFLNFISSVVGGAEIEGSTLLSQLKAEVTSSKIHVDLYKATVNLKDETCALYFSNQNHRYKLSFKEDSMELSQRLSSEISRKTPQR